MAPPGLESESDEARVSQTIRHVLGRGYLGAAAVMATAVLLALGVSASIRAASGQPLLAQSSTQDDLAAAAAAEHSAHYEDAIRRYQDFLTAAGSSTPQSALNEVRIRLATDFFMLHRYQESLDALQPLIPSNSAIPRDTLGHAGSKKAPARPAVPAQAWLVRGLDYLQLSRPGELGQLSEAASSLRQALELNPKSGTARMALGDALARSGNLEGAANEYRQQTRRTPELADAWYKLGSVYADLAGKVAEEFSRMQPRDELAVQLSAERLSDSGDYWGAAQALYPLVRSSGSSPNPTNHGQDSHTSSNRGQHGQATYCPGLHAIFGIALLRLGYSRAAETAFKAELSQDPESLPAQLGSAEIEALGSNWTEALTVFQHLMAAYPKELARQLESPPAAALLKVSQGENSALRPDLANSASGKLWSAWVGSGGLTSVTLSESGFETGRNTGKTQCSAPPSSRQLQPGYWISEACAAQLLRDLRSRRGEKERAKVIEIEYRLGDYEEARADALALLKLAPGDSWGRYWLAKSYSASAGECFAKLAEVNPDSARVHEILARYHSERQQLAAARTEYEAALRLQPELPDLHLGLGTVYWQSGDWTRAQAELTRALKLSPGSAVAAYELGDSYVQQHEWQQAVDYLQRALADPAVERKARLDLAKAQDELGNRIAAIEELTLLAKDDRDGEVHYRLAMAYRQMGDTAKAKAALATSESLRKAADQLSIERLESLEQESKESKSAQGADTDHK